MKAIKAALFALESVAHLQGREATLLPIVEAARAELKALEEAQLLVVSTTPFGEDSWEASATLEDAEKTYAKLVDLPSTYSASICRVIKSTDYS